MDDGVTMHSDVHMAPRLGKTPPDVQCEVMHQRASFFHEAAGDRLSRWAIDLALASALALFLATVRAFGLKHGFSVRFGYWLVLLLGPLLFGRLIFQSLAHGFRRPSEPQAEAPAPALLERLPFQFRNQPILAIESQGHALRVHTDIGAPLIWTGLQSAISELSPLEGWRVHRSWWVARDAITRVERVGRGAVLSLSNGIRVPVSRSRLQLLRRAGLI